MVDEQFDKIIEPEKQSNVVSFSESKKLTNWKNEPTLQMLKEDLEAAKPTQQAQVAKIKHWNDLMYVQGSAAPPKYKNRSSVQPALIRRQAEWRYAPLSEPFLGSKKLFSVNPVTFEDEPAAKQNELLLNYQFRTKMNRIKLIDDFVRSVVDDGTSILQVGWLRETEEYQEEEPIWTVVPLQDPTLMEQMQQAMQLKEANPRGYEEQVPEEIKASIDATQEYGIPVQAIPTGSQVVTKERLKHNEPVVKVLNPANVYIDPSCEGNIDNALFVIVSFETTKADLVREGDRYQNLDQVEWDNNMPLSDGDHETNTPIEYNISGSNRRKVVAYEYWGYFDINGDDILIPIVATWIGSTLIRLEENPFPDQKLPFVVVSYLPVKRELYGEPDATLLEDNQRIIGAVTRGMIDLLGKSANSQQGFAKGMLDPVNRKRMEAGEDYEFNPNMHPSQNYLQHTYPEIPQSAMNMLTLMNNEAEALTGVKSFSGGLAGNAYGDVAAGIRGMLDAASKREMAILRRLAKGITDIGRKIIAMNGIFLSDEEVIRVTNREFVTIRREDLQGDFDLEVDISTAEIDDAKSQDLAFILQTVGPNLDPQIMLYILGEIADLKRIPALAERLRTYQPQPDPMMEQMKQLQLEEQQLKNEKLKSEIEENYAQAEKYKAEALAGPDIMDPADRELKAAQAANLRAQADQKNIDTARKLTGADHKEKMAQMRAQAEGNQDLEVTKALLKDHKPEDKPGAVDAAIGYNYLSKQLRKNSDVPVSPLARNRNDPTQNIGSKYYNPATDPGLNNNLNI